MEQAGAQIVEHTAAMGVMGLPGPRLIAAHLSRLKRIERWLREHPLAAVVPVDSPAANGSICQLVRRTQPSASVVHLVAPQLWAWRAWRVRKLRRLTDELLCLLPFEPDWFKRRRVRATFVGHPLFDPASHPIPEPIHEPAPGPKLALLPGSRRAEIERNWPMMVQTLRHLEPAHPGLTAASAAVDEWAKSLMLKLTPEPPAALGQRIRVGQMDEVVAWADVVLVASGTATLQVARQRKPMVAVYNIPRIYRYLRPLLGWMFATKTFTLPNLVSEHETGQRAIPEFVPLFGQAEPVTEELRRLLSDESARNVQQQRLERVCQAFEGTRYAQTSAQRLLSHLAKAEGAKGSPNPSD
jgi:lipid-A-disaccharide synthase